MRIANVHPMTTTAVGVTRRQILARTMFGLGAAALASLLGENTADATGVKPRAKRVIYLFMHGGASQLDLLDHKPALARLHGTELPPSVRGNQRLTGMTSGQSSFPVVRSLFAFNQRGRS